MKNMKSLQEHLNEAMNRRYLGSDEWSIKCLDALQDEFGAEYDLEQSRHSGAIGFFPKGKPHIMKYLLCRIQGLINNELYADFGPNTQLEKTIGPEIEKIILSIK